MLLVMHDQQLVSFLEIDIESVSPLALRDFCLEIGGHVRGKQK